MVGYIDVNNREHIKRSKMKVDTGINTDIRIALLLLKTIIIIIILIWLFLAYAVCCKVIKCGKTFFGFSERAYDIIFRSTFNKEMAHQFFMNLLSLSFFINLMIACL